MKLLFEYKEHERDKAYLPEQDAAGAKLPPALQRNTPLRIPNISENDLCRHFTRLEEHTFGVNSGFYPLGSCTMKYNPKINEETAALPGFSGIHPLQPAETAQGCMEVLELLGGYLCEITGMDEISLQPAAGAHGEYLGLSVIKAYHRKRGDTARTKIIVPESAHGTNPASATMAGFQIVGVPVRADGCVDLDKMRERAGADTAGLMLTNPNTLGLFEKDILEMADIVHKAGGLLYYDGANLNPIMGIVRPGDMGFDIVHLNLHKTFSAPHGGGGPGAGPVGCKAFLAEFLPVPRLVKKDGVYSFSDDFPNSVGSVGRFYGNFSVCVKALTYILSLGREGLREAAEAAVLNANYLMQGLGALYDVPYRAACMHEFVLSAEDMRKKYGVTAKDIAKALLDYGMHPPTVYFPLCVKEALMVEPTETESKETLDEAIAVFTKLFRDAEEAPRRLLDAPHSTEFKRLDEVTAAREPKLTFRFEE